MSRGRVSFPPFLLTLVTTDELRTVLDRNDATHRAAFAWRAMVWPHSRSLPAFALHAGCWPARPHAARALWNLAQARAAGCTNSK